MSESSSGTLRVPGAGLYYQTRGTGPVLLLLPGGAGDADNPADLAEQLADRFTVLSYDRRGLSRSTIDDPTEPITLRTHAEDAHHLLAALGTEPAFVVGSSIGALIGLDLATRHPEQVRTLFAHEPPSARLLGGTLPASIGGAPCNAEVCANDQTSCGP